MWVIYLQFRKRTNFRILSQLRKVYIIYIMKRKAGDATDPQKLENRCSKGRFWFLILSKNVILNLNRKLSALWHLRNFFLTMVIYICSEAKFSKSLTNNWFEQIIFSGSSRRFMVWSKSDFGLVTEINWKKEAYLFEFPLKIGYLSKN